MDNTMQLISRTNYYFNEYIISQLENKGYSGLVSSHGAIILALKNSPKKMGDLAKSINKDQSTVTTLVKKLLSKDFVKSYKDKNDGRITLLELTEKGENLATEIISISEDLFNATYNGISEEERKSFRKTLNKTIENLKETNKRLKEMRLRK